MASAGGALARGACGSAWAAAASAALAAAAVPPADAAEFMTRFGAGSTTGEGKALRALAARLAAAAAPAARAAGVTPRPAA